MNLKKRICAYHTKIEGKDLRLTWKFRSTTGGVKKRGVSQKGHAPEFSAASIFCGEGEYKRRVDFRRVERQFSIVPAWL